LGGIFFTPKSGKELRFDIEEKGLASSDYPKADDPRWV
jgi:hypothetical protein